jgi:ketosteroid isomerase-like protein
MKHITLFFSFVLSIAHSQDFKKEINEQVWKPFIKTFNGNDAEGFMAVHSKDLVRSPRDNAKVKDWSEYYREVKAGNERDKGLNRKRTIELRFLERIASVAQAVEIGIYKVSNVQPDGTPQDFYGKFFVVLRREDGLWKILVDSDSSEGGTINRQSFLAAPPME